MQCKLDNVIKTQMWPSEASKPGACLLLVSRKVSQRGGAAGASEALWDSTRWGRRGCRREPFLTRPRGYLQVASLFPYLVLGPSFSHCPGLSLPPGSLRCGLVLRPPGAPGPAGWWRHHHLHHTKPPCSIQLPPSLEAPFPASGTAALPSRWLLFFTPHLESSLGSPHFHADVAMGSELMGPSNHQDHETTSRTSVSLDVTSRTVLQVDKLCGRGESWRVSRSHSWSVWCQLAIRPVSD